MDFLSRSPAETQRLGKRLAKKLKGRVIALYGELGAGKTHFVQGLAIGLGIKKRVLSPTFIFIRPYQKEHFYHIDLYRLENEKEASGLGLEEILAEPKVTVAIEWPERIEKLLTGAVTLKFKKVSENTRQIT